MASSSRGNYRKGRATRQEFQARILKRGGGEEGKHPGGAAAGPFVRTRNNNALRPTGAGDLGWVDQKALWGWRPKGRKMAKDVTCLPPVYAITNLKYLRFLRLFCQGVVFLNSPCRETPQNTTTSSRKKATSKKFFFPLSYSQLLYKKFLTWASFKKASSGVFELSTVHRVLANALLKRTAHAPCYERK
jgi:hypothetical protein